MSRKARNRTKIEPVREQPLDEDVESHGEAVHRLTGELHDILEAIVSGCGLLMQVPSPAAMFDLDALDGEDLEDAPEVDEAFDDELDDDVADLADATDAEIGEALDSALDSLGDALGMVGETTRALARTLIARVLDRDLPHPAPRVLPASIPLSRADRNAALDEAAFILREVGLAEFDAWCELAIDPDGAAEMFTLPVSPESAHVSLLEFLFHRAESIALATHPLTVTERDASSWEFSRWSVAPPPGASLEAADFSRHVREQEYSLADRRLITLGASVIGELADDDGFAELFPRHHHLARALAGSFVDVFQCVALDGRHVTLRSVRDGRTYGVHEHMDPIEYGTGWICAGRLLPFADALHLRSPGMIFVRPVDTDLARDAAGALERLGRTLPPALALEGVISSVVFGVNVPRAKKPAPTRADARETLAALQAVLADPEFADATPDPTLEGFMGALAEQAEAGRGRPSQPKARRAKKPKRRR